MPELENGKSNIEFIKGATNILLIAPHGHEKGDENTGKLTRLVAEHSGCYAIINEFYGRKATIHNKINLNYLPHVKKYLKNEFLYPLLEYKDKIVKNHGSTLVFWIHGAKNKSVRDDIQKDTSVNSRDIKVLVGYGQKRNNNRLTTEPETANTLIDALTKNGLDAVAANPNIPKGVRSFCAHDINNMNQLFRHAESGKYKDLKVQSFQLEFRKLGCRDTEKNIEDTAHKLVKAISALLPHAIEPEIVGEESTKDIVPMDDDYDEKVESAYEHIKGIFIKKFQETMLEIGQFLINHFYDGNYDKAKSKPFTHNHSLKRLYEKLETETSGNLPKKSWMYNSINLAIAEKEFGKVSTYGKLTRSHKVLLAGQKKLDKDTKIQLMEKTVDGKWTVIRLQDEVSKLNDNKNSPRFSLKKPMSKNQLMKYTPKRLKKIQTDMIELEKEAKEQLELYEDNLELIRQALEAKSK